jgi:hypothetical protein
VETFIFLLSRDSLSEEQQGAKVHSFINMLMEEFVPRLWKPEDFDIISECIEKLIMENLYSK